MFEVTKRRGEMIEKLHSPLGNTEKKVNEIIDWVIALCNMHDFDRHLHLSALQSYAPVAPALDTKQEKCPDCSGNGRVPDNSSVIWTKKCKKCHGTGTIGDK